MLWLIMYYKLRIARVFTKGPGDRGSIPGRVIPKSQNIVLDAPLLNTQHYKVWIKGKEKQSRERSNALLYNLAIEKGPFRFSYGRQLYLSNQIKYKISAWIHMISSVPI